MRRFVDCSAKNPPNIRRTRITGSGWAVVRNPHRAPRSSRNSSRRWKFKKLRCSASSLRKSLPWCQQHRIARRWLRFRPPARLTPPRPQSRWNQPRLQPPLCPISLRRAPSRLLPSAHSLRRYRRPPQPLRSLSLPHRHLPRAPCLRLCAPRSTAPYSHRFLSTQDQQKPRRHRTSVWHRRSPPVFLWKQCRRYA